MDYAVILTVIGAMTILVNILTQVIKPLTYNKVPTEILATSLSVVLTLLAYFAYADYANWAITWYTVAAAVVVGLLVSYSAQVGYDKFYDKIKDIFNMAGSKDNPVISTWSCTRSEYWKAIEMAEVCPEGSEGADDRGKMLTHKNGLVEFVED